MFKYILIALALTEASLAAPRSFARVKRQVPAGASAPGFGASTSASAHSHRPTGTAAASASAPATTGTSGGNGTLSGETTTASSSYQTYKGDGSVAAGWPDQSKIVQFDDLWTINEPLISKSCTNNQFDPTDNSPTENNDLKNAIKSISAAHNIDSSLVLAMMMQESHGCVRVPITSASQPNPGVMQDDNGPNNCNPAMKGQPSQGVNPCPTSKIQGMISDSITFGPNSLGACVKASKNPNTAQGLFQAAFLYNGNVADNQSDLTGTTPCYASDIANRLTGWTDATAPSPCGS